MLADADLAAVAELMSSHRASLLLALIGGKPLNAGELAARAGISPSLTSSHLARLLDGGLVDVEQHGRQRIYRLANADVAHVIETMLSIAPAQHASDLRGSRRGAAIRHARTCYDHLAGEVGVALTDSLEKQRLISAQDRAYQLTDLGERRLGRLGIDVSALRAERRAFARPCLDWTERRPHLAGALGAGIAGQLLALEWFSHLPGTRALRVTEAGRRGLLHEFALNVSPHPERA